MTGSIAIGTAPPGDGAVSRRSSSRKSNVRSAPPIPETAHSARIPSMKPKSATRFTMNAFLPASAAEGLAYQWPMSKYEQNPTSYQPMNSWIQLLASTIVSMEKAKSDKTPKNRLYPSSSAM